MDFLRYKTSNPDHQALTDEIGSNLMQPIYDECDYIPSPSVTSTQHILDDNISDHQSIGSEGIPVHDSTDNEDETVDHNLHKYEDTYDKENEHHSYL